MAVSCQKQITIKVNSGTPLASAYWTLQESGLATDRVDMVHSVHCVPNGLNVGLDATPGLFGNGLGFTETGALCSIQSGPNDANLAITSANGWSMCFWFKVLHWADNLPFNTGWSVPPTVSYDASFGAQNASCVVQFDPLAVNGLTFTIQDNNLNNFAPANYFPVLGAWTFLHVFFDPATTKVGYQINNGAKVLDPTPGATFIASNGGSMNFFQTWAFANTATMALIVDEVLLQLSRILTAAEVTYLFNGSAGRTWPL